MSHLSNIVFDLASWNYTAHRPPSPRFHDSKVIPPIPRPWPQHPLLPPSIGFPSFGIHYLSTPLQPPLHDRTFISGLPRCHLNIAFLRPSFQKLFPPLPHATNNQSRLRTLFRNLHGGNITLYRTRCSTAGVPTGWDLNSAAAAIVVFTLNTEN